MQYKHGKDRHYSAEISHITSSFTCHTYKKEHIPRAFTPELILCFIQKVRTRDKVRERVNIRESEKRIPRDCQVCIQTHIYPNFFHAFLHSTESPILYRRHHHHPHHHYFADGFFKRVSNSCVNLFRT